MRLLIITQKSDEQDAVLGFMHGWIAEFARQAEKVSVICLEKGTTNLPLNVRVLSLGKEESNFQFSIFNFQSIFNVAIFKRLKYSWRFLRYIVGFRSEYDAVFVHMNPEYAVLGGLLWKLWGKTVTLWYAHKSTPWHLRLALYFIDIVFTSTKSGFRLQSKKVRIIGQGIDTDRFKILDSRLKIEEEKFKIVTVGRITPSKDYDVLIDAIEKICKESSVPIKVDIVGPTSVISDKEYLKQLKEKVERKGLSKVITFKGPIANSELPEVLAQYDLFVNMGHTGSLDKAVPEAMAVGLPVLTCNEAFNDVLGRFRGDLMYSKGDAQALGGRILWVLGLSEQERRTLGEQLREIVVHDHSLKTFVKKIISIIESKKQHD